MEPIAVSNISMVAKIAALVAGYLLGSLPFGLWISRANGVNILSVGSGNPGMTNVWRSLGWKSGLSVALLDTLKGLLAAWVGLLLTGSPLWALLAGIAAVLGHSFSFWIGFKGGKSVLTAFGVFLFLSPLASLGAFLIWAVTMALFRYVSLASICAAIALPLLVLVETRGTLSPVFWAALAIAVFITVRHRANIGRLLRGTEPQFLGENPVNRILQRLEEGKLYYSISEVCRMTGLEPHVLRYWETEFAQMRPKKNGAGNRAYRPREIQYIQYIRHLLHEEKYTLQGAKKKLAEVSFEEVTGQTTLLRVPPVDKASSGNASVAGSPSAISEAVVAPAAPAVSAGLSEDQRKELESIRAGLKDVLKMLEL